MNNRNKTYAKVMLAVAIGFSVAAEVVTFALKQHQNGTNNTISEISALHLSHRHTQSHLVEPAQL